jgi:hypothetical protein
MDDFVTKLAQDNKRTREFFWHQFGKYGSYFLLAALMTALTLKGMPLYSLCPSIIGSAILIATALLFAKTVQYGGILVGTWWIERDLRCKKQSGSPTEDPDYKPPQPRSGRRRTR